MRVKTKIRRLYDIANVLSSLRLIEKTHTSETRKPAFRWLGASPSMLSALAAAAAAEWATVRGDGVGISHSPAICVTGLSAM